jgi:glycosyltransferase involved in cell wall biosynthesis
MKKTSDILVAQLGARMHYAVPRLLARADRLNALYTDFCASSLPLFSRLSGTARKWQPTTLRKALSRDASEVPARKIHAENALGLAYSIRLRRARDEAAYLRVVLNMGHRFARHVSRADWGGVRAAYAFNGAALEILQKARAVGALGVVEQTIAPKRYEEELLSRARLEFPPWDPALRPSNELELYIDREEQEWRHANLIVCASPFVADQVTRIMGIGAPVAVVQYGVDARKVRRVHRSEAGPLRVVTVGTLGLRKGTPYLFSAARTLHGVAEFRLVGDAKSVPPGAMVPDNVTLVGSVSRPEVDDALEWADVFLLPSLCEGSATATYEALGAGLPVVCTPNTGSVIRNGVDGVIIPPFSSEAIATAIGSIEGDRARLEAMSMEAARRADEFSVEAYGRRLISVLDAHMSLASIDQPVPAS